MGIDKSWIDYKGHMKMAYYNVLFKKAGEDALSKMGLGFTYAMERGFTSYAAEVHICCVRELHLGDEVTATFHLLDHDEKRIRFFQELRHVEGWLAATAEQLSLHIDMSGPRVVPYPSDILPTLEQVQAAHAVLGTPVRAGKRIAIASCQGPALHS